MDQESRPHVEPSWLLPREAAARARVSVRTIYTAARSGRIRVARVNGRRELRFRPEWVDQFLEDTSTPVEVLRRG
jgi:excisionase family DNA binding protein